MTAPYKDLASFIRALDRRRDVLKVVEELSPRFEIAAALRYLDRRTEKAVLFKKVGGFDVAVAGNLFESYRSLAVAFGVEGAEAVAAEYLRRSGRRVQPKVYRSGPVKEVVLKDGIDILKTMPVLTHHEKDAGSYFSSAITMAKDPETGIRGMGIHRIQVKGPKKIGIFLSTPPLSKYLAAAEARNSPLEIAIVVGIDPLTFLASITYGIEGADKLDIAGGLMGKPVELVKAETVDLEVPRHAEYVLEGTILPGVRETEGPFGESGGAYLTVQNPVANISCICHKAKPIYHALMPFNRENGIIMSLVWEAGQFAPIQREIPQVRKIRLWGSTGEIAAVQIAKKNEDDGKAVIRRLFDLIPRSKGIVVVDTDVDVTDAADVEWAVFARFQVSRDLVTVGGMQGSVLDPSTEGGLTSRWGLDATKPLAEASKYERIAPPPWAMEKVKSLFKGKTV